MWDRKEVKAIGKVRFKANYWKSVLCALLLSVLAGGTSVISRFNLSDTEPDNYDGSVTFDEESINEMEQTFTNMPDEDKAIAGLIVLGVIGIIFVIFLISFLIKIFVFNPLQVGCYGFFRENAGGLDVGLDIIKTGFTKYGHTFITLFLRDLFILLWCLLFIVPGIIKSYSYRMVPFILRDNPDLSPTEVITASRRMMDGHKWNMFVFDLSYIGWALLGAITFGLVNVFWTEPYRQNANAVIYLKLIGEDVAELEQDIAVYPVSSEPDIEPAPEPKLELEPSPEPEVEAEPEPEIKLELDSTLETEPDAPVEPDAPSGEEPDAPVEPETEE